MSRTIKILAVRHGQPDTEFEPYPLTPKGVVQADLAADLIEPLVARASHVQIIVSPAFRARQTAQSLARRCGIEPHIAVWLGSGPDNLQVLEAVIAADTELVVLYCHEPSIRQLLHLAGAEQFRPRHGGVYLFELERGGTTHSLRYLRAAPSS